jgi:2-polyprenyl-3-methyl-5-hydroxy-6-metoxy-1,4-benzoquinol methylase
MTAPSPESPISPVEDRYQEIVRWSRNGQFDEAIGKYKKLLEEDPAHIRCWGQIAYLYELQEKIDKAIECYLTILEIDPSASLAYLRLGDCYFGKGDRRHARAAYLSLKGTELFENPEVQKKLSLTESAPQKILRRLPTLIGVLLGKAFSPQFVREIAAELADAWRSRSVIRGLGLSTYCSFMSQRFLEREWYRIPKASCDLCGSNEFETIFYHRFQKIVRCRRCGLEASERKPDQGLDVHTGNYEKEEIIREFESLGWNDEAQQLERIEKIRSLYRSVGEEFPKARTRVFEIGFGEGYLLKALEDLGCQVSGVETSQRLVEYAREMLNLSAEVKTVRDMRSDDGPFDLIVAYHVLEHLDSPSLLLTKSRDLLADGGALFIEIPVANLRSMPLSKKLDPSIGYANLFHMTFFTAETAKKLFEKSGFEVAGEYTVYPETHPTSGFLLRKKAGREEQP